MKTGSRVRASIGAFVKATSVVEATLGIGKIVELTGGRATVAYFDVPGGQEAVRVDVSTSDLRPVTLVEQTRVFHLDETTGHWRVGRIVDDDGDQCLVAFPGAQTINLPRSDLLVRWGRPIVNPLEFLIRHVTETPYFAESRSNFMRGITAQRAACRGMGALLSSSVQLVDYQFNVVQQVLQDPVQRYLLADEVGLGKTIEAGILIRQCIIDSPNARILVVVPKALVSQWRQELSQRFGLVDWLDDFIFVQSDEDIEGISALLPTATMLVVDEAHHLSREMVSGEVNVLYETLRRHCERVPRLLLLSATPVLTDTAGFLRMLHLLDPVVFSLDDLEGFEHRLEARHVVAELVASLVPENVLSMEDDLDRLEENFGDDALLIERVKTLRLIVQEFPEEDDESFLRALSDVRGHITETYKLHRRILRNRRKAVPWATPRRKGVDLIRYSCARRRERSDVLEELRVHLLNAGLLTPVRRSLFAAAVHPNGKCSVSSLLQRKGIDDPYACEMASRIDFLASQSKEYGERERVVTETIRDLLLTPGLQVVVFCDQTDVADSLNETLQRELQRETNVVRHASLDQQSLEDGEVEAWHDFLSLPNQCRVLVCDASAEEGLNLHGGRKVALHFDLPEEPNRIEQRLGRLDRFGGDSVLSMAVVCEDDPVEQVWMDCLIEGLGVFDRSIASLQYLLEETLNEAVMGWCNEGIDALLQWKTGLEGPDGWVEREQRRIDQQEALDAMGESYSDAFDDLEAVDDDWLAWKDAFESFAFGSLLFNKRNEEWIGPLPPGENVFRLNYSREGKRQTLLSLPDFVRKFLGTIDLEAAYSTSRSPLTYPYAFRRNTVLSKEGRTRGLRSLRYGDSLVQSLYSFCQSDDRGRVFALWRHLPNFEVRDSSGTDLWFRFDFLVEASLAQPEDDIGRALWRRADKHFPPQFHTVWVDMAGDVTMFPPDDIAQTYTSTEKNIRRDFNLNALRWQVLKMQDQIPWSLEWEKHCKHAEQRALDFLISHELVRRHIERGLLEVEREHKERVAQLESRMARLSDSTQTTERRDFDSEGVLHALLNDAINNPSIRTDVVGAMFVSATNPFVR